MNAPRYQGTAAHQALQRALVTYYAGDPRIAAIAVFGSIGRGNWDAWSDLDLDVVLADGVSIDVLAEVRALCASLAPLVERALLIVPYQNEAADVVLASLRQFSIRYHPLPTTSPNIVDSLHLLAGPLRLEQIIAAGLGNRIATESDVPRQLDIIVRWMVDADNALRRANSWQALNLLQRIREQLLVVFAGTHGSGRPYHSFDAQAPPALQRQLRATLHPADLAGLDAAWLALVDLIENHIGAFTGDQAQLSAKQREVLTRVRCRQPEINRER